MVIMHISDLHFGIPDKSMGDHVRNREMILNSFLENLKELPMDLLPDVLVITGDIGYSGSKEDYESAKDFIRKMIENLNGKITTDDIIVCPGNHDVCFPPQRRYEMRPSKDNLETPNLEPLTRENIEASTSKFNNYVNFLKELKIHELENSASESQDEKMIGYLYGYRELKGIQFVVLNSEWDFFGKNDKGAEGCLRLGCDLVADALEFVREQDEGKPVIAIFHRPINPYIHISERNEHNKDLKNVEHVLNTNADIILNGHVHVGNIKNEEGGKAWSFSCGTLHSVDVEKPEFYLFKFDNGTYRVIRYKWVLPDSRRKNGYWKPDDISDDIKRRWIIGMLDPHEEIKKYFIRFEQIIGEYKEGSIDLQKSLDDIKEEFPSDLQEVASELFKTTIMNVSDKNIAVNGFSEKGYEKALTYGDEDSIMIKEEKKISE